MVPVWLIIGIAGKRQVYCLAAHHLPTALGYPQQRVSQPWLALNSHLSALLCGRPNRPHYRSCPSVRPPVRTNSFQVSRFHIMVFYCRLIWLRTDSNWTRKQKRVRH